MVNYEYSLALNHFLYFLHTQCLCPPNTCFQGPENRHSPNSYSIPHSCTNNNASSITSSACHLARSARLPGLHLSECRHYSTSTKSFFRLCSDTIFTRHQIRNRVDPLSLTSSFTSKRTSIDSQPNQLELAGQLLNLVLLFAREWRNSFR
ncbi:hypothetical protein SDC9_99173 [bioreactor metagenome]|uniref:Uncharacterized protein n=1 Tax=bioreactor metagenome TaxID=1076179 RepID=A0A645AS43_9ZZZZ